MKEFNLAAVVVLYHPEESFLLNIKTYINAVEYLYVVDNSEKTGPDLYAELKMNPKVTLIADGINYGIAKALNLAAEKALLDGYEWLLTMDQDSYFLEEQIISYLSAVETFSLKEKVAMFGLPYTADFQSNLPADQKFIGVNSMITSGSILNLSTFSKVGHFNEKLFIDEVDHEYCYRAKLSGYQVICVRAGLLQHSLGESRRVKRFSDGSSKLSTLHNPVRIYYMVRNGLYIRQKFKETFPSEARKRIRIVYVTVKNNLLYGDKRLSVLKHFFLGVWHFIKNRYYKL